MFPDILLDDAFRLETRRLWLRWPRVADAAAIAKYAGEAAVSQYTARVPHPYPRSEAECFVLGCRSGNASGEQLTLALTRKGKPAELIGMVGLQARASGGLELGFWLGEPFWKQGLMSETVEEVAALSFSATPAALISAIVRDDNKGSQALLQSCGFERVQDLRVNMPMRGGIFPCGKYRLGRNDWLERETDRFRRKMSAPRTADKQMSALAAPA